MEQVMLDMDEWSMDEGIVHKSGDGLLLNVKKRVRDTLELKDRSKVRVYFKKIGDNVPRIRDVKKLASFKKIDKEIDAELEKMDHGPTETKEQ